MAPSAAPPDGAPGDTVGVPIHPHAGAGQFNIINAPDKDPFVETSFRSAPPLLLRRTRPPFLLLSPVQSRNPSNRPYRRFCNPMRPGRNCPGPPYSLPLLLHYPRDHLSSDRYQLDRNARCLSRFRASWLLRGLPPLLL
ncbi:hypothetical protein L249_7104 [Ophiocordyceps polyrhachis-furcata BCC 54312]|uniref:Uncharacterized protein n=1 Tax=Ophiocordyceps polyrhachis-furcata BCC 54312 TaxID=1330021 RepID=A0A367LKI4_9HYPO|nr:hypothetical protein L249_7104 [Ophiocordyceps polyrhachis-furcata BCC 54312]